MSRRFLASRRGALSIAAGLSVLPLLVLLFLPIELGLFQRQRIFMDAAAEASAVATARRFAYHAPRWAYVLADTSDSTVAMPPDDQEALFDQRRDIARAQAEAQFQRVLFENFNNHLPTPNQTGPNRRAGTISYGAEYTSSHLTPEADADSLPTGDRRGHGACTGAQFRSSDQIVIVRLAPGAFSPGGQTPSGSDIRDAADELRPAAIAARVLPQDAPAPLATRADFDPLAPVRVRARHIMPADCP